MPPPLFAVDPAGFVRGAVRAPSPHHDERPPDTVIDLLVIHNISLPPGEFGGPAIIDLFSGRLDTAAHPWFAGLAGVRVSAHFLVRRDGKLVQFVDCGHRAWHAGESVWRGRVRCNDYSIGVELEGTDDEPFADPQYRTLVALTVALQQVYPIVDIVGHSDIAPGRKTDPGPHFDWGRYRASLQPAG